MDNSFSFNNNYYLNVEKLIEDKNLIEAENLLNKFKIKTDKYYYLYSLLLEKKAWFDSSLESIKQAVRLAPQNSLYNDRLLQMSRRHRRYSDGYYDNGYRRNRGCSCCCCDDCCCDCGHFSCCDLICLDQCCECMGGDLIDCI